MALATFRSCPSADTRSVADLSENRRTQRPGPLVALQALVALCPSLVGKFTQGGRSRLTCSNLVSLSLTAAISSEALVERTSKVSLEYQLSLTPAYRIQESPSPAAGNSSNAEDDFLSLSATDQQGLL